MYRLLNSFDEVIPWHYMNKWGEDTLARKNWCTPDTVGPLRSDRERAPDYTC